jgi:hypothetical protein
MRERWRLQPTDYTILASAPDEPVHPKACNSCHRFLPQAGWAYEEMHEGRDRWLAWFIRCRACGWLNSHEP